MKKCDSQSPLFSTLYRLLPAVLLLLLLAAPLTARAEEKNEDLDGRLEGYAQPAALPEPGSHVLTWMFFGFLTTIVVSALFKNSKRSHLD